MNSSESAKLVLAASGGDTVKLFDISGEPQNPCLLTYSPSPGSRVNSVKWNHNNLVLASAGDDSKISLWRKNGQSLWTVPVETTESISAISFSNKGSRYLCSGGTGQVVRIWDLQNKRCVKWLKGHTDTITGIMYNCRDEYIASVSRKGDLILHNLSSGTKADLRDPNGQVLGALDYSRMSRHLLVTAGDDGSIHLWDTTGRNPKASWLNQHSAPTSSVSFSPSNDKIIASVGLDMKLYTFDSGSRKPTSCISYEAPFSSLSFTDDGLTLAAGTSTGKVVFYDVRGKPQPITVLRAYANSEAVTNLCWQRSKPVPVNENNCTDENVLLAGDIGDSVVMPDPLPSRASSSLSMAPGVRNPVRSSSGDLFSFSTSSSAEETPLRSSLLTGGSLRLNALRNFNFKDDMEVFSPLVEVQPVTPSLEKLWDDHDSSKKDLDRKPSFLFPSRKFGLSEDRDNHPVFDRKASPLSKPLQDEIGSTLSPLISTPTSTRPDDPSSITPPEAWGGEKLSDKHNQNRHSINMPSRFATGLQDIFPTNRTTNSSTSGPSLKNLYIRETPNQETPFLPSEPASPLLSVKGGADQSTLDPFGTALPLPRRSYAERIGAQPFSPKSKKTGVETREEPLKNMLLRSELPFATGSAGHASNNGGGTLIERTTSPSDSQGTSFTLQLFQRTLEETLGSFQKSIHEDMRNLHIEVLRQFHLQEMEMSSNTKLILENQAEIMKELQSLRRETQQLRQLL